LSLRSIEALISVRADDRRVCSEPAVLRPGAESSEFVRLSSSAGDGDGTARGTLADVSRRGLRVRTGVFFPRGSMIDVWLPKAVESPAWVRCLVQRVVMRDPGPTYDVGVTIADASIDDPRVSEYLRELIAGGTSEDRPA
jgi:PilZ domain